MNGFKTRAWNEEKHFMHYFSGVFNVQPFRERSTFPQYESIKEYYELEFMLCAGIKDKSGRLAFHGDIVIVSTSGPPKQFTSILSVDNRYGILFGKIRYSSLVVEYDDFEFEIIGNIHENPELKPMGRKG